jgi:hypothetical protein
MKRTHNAYRMAQQLTQVRAVLMGEEKSKYNIFPLRVLLRSHPLSELTPEIILQFFETAVPLAGPLETPCLIWPEPRDQKGYGLFYANGKRYSAHRLAYTLMHGAIPEKKEVCHLCDNSACINGDHLQAGTHKENMEHRAEAGRTRNQHIPAPLPILSVLPAVEYEPGEMVI